MPRRALWRGHPDDPKTALGWLLADADARPLSIPVSMGLAVAILGLASLWSVWLFLALPALALYTRPPHRPTDLTPLQTTPPPGPAFACRIGTFVEANRTALYPGLFIGQDEGVLTFVEGWLHFAGRRTDFAIRSPDLRATALLGPRRLVWFEGETCLAIVPLDDRDADFLNRAFRNWERQETTPVPAGDTILPPSSVHPSGLARAWHGVLTTSAALGAVFGVTWMLMATLPFFFFVFGGGWPAFHRLAKLRRLFREERLARLEGRAA